MSAGTLSKIPRRMRCRVISANQRSTRLSHELLVGVKCTCTRGWRASQRRVGLGVEAFEEQHTLARALSGVALAITTPVDQAQRGIQRRGAVPRVVVGLSLGQARLQRQDWARAVERLNVGLFIDAEDHGLVRRIQIQADHVAQLVDEVRVFRVQFGDDDGAGDFLGRDQVDVRNRIGKPEPSVRTGPYRPPVASDIASSTAAANQQRPYGDIRRVLQDLQRAPALAGPCSAWRRVSTTCRRCVLLEVFHPARSRTGGAATAAGLPIQVCAESGW